MSQRLKRAKCRDCGIPIYPACPSTQRHYTGRCKRCDYQHRSPFRLNEKRCSGCKQWKPLKSYHAKTGRPANSMCIPCENAWWVAYRAKNRLRVRVNQRKWERKNAKGISTKKMRRYRTEPEYRERVLARQKVYLAVKSGRLERGPCSMCGTSKKVHGHHKDHSMPLDVVWLCMDCHLKEHGACVSSP
jgi:hypothetical protein